MNKSIFCYALTAGLFLHTAVQAHDGDKEPAPAFGNTSLQLIANKGQVTDQHGKLRPDIDAKAEYNGVTMFVGDGQLHYQWVRSESQKSKVKTSKGNPNDQNPNSKGSANSSSPLVEKGQGDEVSIYRMDVTLVGANKNVQPVFEQPTGYFENYYLAHTGENGVQAKGYNRVVYKNVYPNIDWIIYTSPRPSPQVEREMGLENSKEQREQKSGSANSPSPLVERGPGGEVLKYDFIVHPGGNAADIRMRYDGATELKIEDGALVAVTPHGSITEDAPYSYMQDGGAVVASKYILEGNELRFDVGSYEGTLVIDPKLGWCTYFTENRANGQVTSDTAGNGYLIGATLNTSIATSGIHQQVLAGSADVYMVKFNAAGARVWCTYYGGTGAEGGYGICADLSDNIYICGSTNSPNGIHTSMAYQTALDTRAAGNTIDGFIAKFNVHGQRIWGTYYGDSITDVLLMIKTDTAGNLVVLGETDNALSTAFGSTGTFGPTVAMGKRYIARFTPGGQRVWGSYVPGYVSSVAIDNGGNVYIAGSVDNTVTTGIGTNGTHQPAFGGGFGDAFLMKLYNNGQRAWGTYYGGTGSEGIADVYCSDSNYIHVCGSTGSSNGISTAGTYQTALAGVDDGFLARFNAAGKLVWGSYYGTTGLDHFNALISTPRQGIICVGRGGVFGGQATSNAFQKTTDGFDGIVVEFDSLGQRIWASYLGGTGNATLGQHKDYLSSCALSAKKHSLYVGGYTTSTTGLATTGAYKTSYNTAEPNAPFVARIVLDDTMVYIKHSFADTPVCTGDTMHVPYDVTFRFRGNNSFKVQLSNSSGSFASPATLATVTDSLAGVIACYVPFSVTAGTGYRIRIIATAPIDTSEINLADIRIFSGIAGFSKSVNKNPLCTADTLRLSSTTTTSGVTYAWTGPNSFTAGTANTSIPNPSVAATGKYFITINNTNCVRRDSIAITVAQSPENVTATNNGPVCTGDTLRMNSSSTTAGVTYNWSPGNYSTQNVTIPNVAKTQGGVYTVTATLGSCTTTATTTAQVEQAPVINIVPTAGVALCIGELAQFAAFLNDAGANPQMIWQVNGVDKAGETTTTFKTATLNHGDKVRLKVIPNTSCPGTRYSNEITMGIYAPKAPTVSIVADINPPWHDNTIVTFTATAANATSVTGVPPTYQWKKSGQDIGGAISNYWAVNTNALNDNDKICVLVTSAYECPVPDTVLSNCINTQFTGVEDVAMGTVNVYPNPVTNALHINGVPTGYSVALYDVVGRKCDVEYRNDEIDMSALPAGNYVLQVTDASGERAYFKVTKE